MWSVDQAVVGEASSKLPLLTDLSERAVRGVGWGANHVQNVGYHYQRRFELDEANNQEPA